jgi:hypothetical protein
LGWWVERKRRLSLLVLREAGFLGTELATFKQIFFKHRPSKSQKGHMFFCAPLDFQKAAMMRSMANKVLPCNESMTWERAIGPANSRRLVDYDRSFQDFIDKQLVKHGVSEEDVQFLDGGQLDELQGSLMNRPIVNIAQCVDQKGGTAVSGNHVPTLMTSSLLYSLYLRRPMLGSEYLMCQGMPALSDELGLFSQPCFPHSAFADKDLSFLAGNAVHSALAGALTAFALAYFVHRTPDQFSRMDAANEDTMDEDL